MNIKDQECNIISYQHMKNPDPAKEFGFIIRLPGEKLVIEMSREEMTNLINNTINYLLPELLKDLNVDL